MRRLHLGRLRRPETGPTASGRAVVALGATSLALGRGLGLRELLVVGLAAVLLTLAAAAWVRTPTGAEATWTLVPGRGVAGGSVVGVLRVRGARGTSWFQSVEVRSGDEVWSAAVGQVVADRATVARVEIPTPRRGRVPLSGPVLVRTDPTGLARREVPVAPASTLVVRPRSIEVSWPAQGVRSDSEGRASDLVSMDDLAFHGLREYRRGDDLRHVHWTASARAGELVVRQYHDTQQGSVRIVLDPRRAAYGTDEDFELAVEVAASLVVAAMSSGSPVELDTGGRLLARGAVGELLDELAVVQTVTDDPPERMRGQVEVLVLVTGADTGPRSWSGADRRVLVASGVPSPGVAGGGPVGRLGDLGAVVASWSRESVRRTTQVGR